MPIPARPPSRKDVAFAAGTFAIGGLLHAIDAAYLIGDSREHVPLRVALLAVMCLAQMMASQFPRSMLAAGMLLVTGDILLGALTVPVLIVLGEQLFALVRYGPARAGRRVLPLLAVVTVALTVLAAVLTRETRFVVLVPLLAVALFASPVLWARDVRRQQELADVERLRADELVLLATHDRQAAVAAERTRMARELHDVIASHLSAIALQSTAALSQQEPDRSSTALAAIRQNSVEALTEMRAMIGLLRDSDTAEASTTAPARLRDLDTLLAAARNSGLDLHVERGHLDEIPTAIDLTAYRIAQEAITNACRHAPGARTAVSLHVDDSELVLDISNDNPGTTAPHGPGNGTGLDNMRDRAESVGGTLRAGRHDDRWRVHARLPLEGTSP